MNTTYFDLSSLFGSIVETGPKKNVNDDLSNLFGPVSTVPGRPIVLTDLSSIFGPVSTTPAEPEPIDDGMPLKPLTGCKKDVNNLHFYDDNDDLANSNYVGLVGYDPRACSNADVDYALTTNVSQWINWSVHNRICERIHESFMKPELQPHVSVGSFLSSYLAWPKNAKPVEICSVPPDNNIYVNTEEDVAGTGTNYRTGAVCLYIDGNVINMRESHGIECGSASEFLPLAELLRVKTFSCEPETDYNPLNPSKWCKFSSTSLNLTSILTVSGRVVKLRGSFTLTKDLLTRLSQTYDLETEGLDNNEPVLEPERETGKFLSFLSRYAAWPKELPNNYNITDIPSEEVFLFMYNNLICMRDSLGIEYESMSPEYLPFLPLEELLRVKTIAQDTYYNPRNGLKWRGASLSSSCLSLSLTTSISTESGLIVKIRGSVTATKELLTRLSKTKY